MTPDVKAKESAMDFSLFYTIMYYVVLIILGPITTFFVSKIVVFEGIFKASTVTSDVASAVTAVVILHIIVGIYIYRAYVYADTGKPKPVKID